MNVTLVKYIQIKLGHPMLTTLNITVAFTLLPIYSQFVSPSAYLYLNLYYIKYWCVIFAESR